MFKSTIFITLFFPLWSFCSQECRQYNDTLPTEILQEHIYPFLINRNDQRSFNFTCRSFAKHILMPQQLHEKIFERKLHRRCVFLTSVYEKDYDSVQWILDHDITHTREPSYDRFFYYSLCFSEFYSSYLTPHMVAHYNQDKKMMGILQPLMGSLVQEGQNIADKNAIDKLNETEYLKYIHNDLINYPMCMAACGKTKTFLLQIYNMFDIFKARGNNGYTAYFILLAALINDDIKLLNCITSINQTIKISLGYFFYHIVGFDNGKTALFRTDTEITNLINHQLFFGNKNLLLGSVHYFMGYCYRIAEHNSLHLQHVAQLLMENGAERQSYYTDTPNQSFFNKKRITSLIASLLGITFLGWFFWPTLTHHILHGKLSWFNMLYKKILSIII